MRHSDECQNLSYYWSLFNNSYLTKAFGPAQMLQVSKFTCFIKMDSDIRQNDILYIHIIYDTSYWNLYI